MNDNEPKFDGAKWYCPQCRSTLATIVEMKQFPLATMKAKMVAALELPSGYVKPSGGIWLRPKKHLPFGRGTQNQKSRIKTKQFRQWQLDTAIKKHDGASIGQSQMDLARIAANAAAASGENVEIKPARFSAEELPIKVKCPKSGCEHISQLTSIRACPNMAQRDKA